MKLFSSSTVRSALTLAVLLSPLLAQTNLNSLSAVVSVTPPEKIVAKRDQVFTTDLLIQVKNGYHVNSNTPDDEYLIPLKFTWSEDVVKLQDIVYPKPAMEKFQFSSKPVSVFQGDFKTKAIFKVPATARPGLSQLNGKLRYQACNERACLAPRTLDVKIPIEIRN